MNSLRVTLFALVCVGGLALPESASAANLAGNWVMNFPSNPTTWTFTQATPTSLPFSATTTVVSGLLTYTYTLNGVTIGPLVLASESLSVQGSPPYQIGVLVSFVPSNTMFGTLIPVTGPSMKINGHKQ